MFVQRISSAQNIITVSVSVSVFPPFRYHIPSPPPTAYYSPEMGSPYLSKRGRDNIPLQIQGSKAPVIPAHFPLKKARLFWELKGETTRGQITKTQPSNQDQKVGDKSASLPSPFLVPHFSRKPIFLYFFSFFWGGGKEEGLFPLSPGALNSFSFFPLCLLQRHLSLSLSLSLSLPPSLPLSLSALSSQEILEGESWLIFIGAHFYSPGNLQSYIIRR